MLQGPSCSVQFCWHFWWVCRVLGNTEGADESIDSEPRKNPLAGIPMNKPCDRVFDWHLGNLYCLYGTVLQACARQAAEGCSRWCRGGDCKPASEGSRGTGWRGLWCKERRVFWGVSESNRLWQLTLQGLSRSSYHDSVTVKGTQLTIQMKHAALTWLQLTWLIQQYSFGKNLEGSNIVMTNKRISRTWVAAMVQATVERESDKPKEPEWGVLAKKERPNIEFDLYHIYIYMYI